MDQKGAPKVKYTSWNKKWDFLFTSAGWSIGLGNVWRFPYLCYKYGGGVFIIPYLLFAVCFVFPIFLIETTLGQWKRKGMVKSWEFSPILKGIGYSQIFLLMVDKVYYSALLVWICKYFVASFSRELPWMSCDWSKDENCRTFLTNGTFNQTDFKNTTSSAELYWNEKLLEKSSGIDNLGSISLENIMYLFLVWTMVYFAIFKGVGWAAKVAYVTATLPVILIIVVLVRAVTLPGAANGIRKFLFPDFSQLLNFEMWVAAAQQMIFTTGAGCGAYVTLRSHNNYHDNFYRDGIFIIVSNFITSVISGLGTFSTLGFMASYMNTTLDKVVDSGFGLVFIACPQTLSLLPLPQLWCALFFLMLFLLGFDTQFATAESIVETLNDLIPSRFFPKKYKKELLSLVICLILFLCTHICVTQGGIYIVHLLNHYVYSWNILLVVCLQFIAVGWFYGANKFWRKAEMMIGRRRYGIIASVSWKYIGPLISMTLAIYTVAKQEPLVYGSYRYPSWANALGHILSFSCFAWVPCFAIYQCTKTKKKIKHLLSERETFPEEMEEVKYEIET